MGRGLERGFLISRKLSPRSWLGLCSQPVTLNFFQSFRTPSPQDCPLPRDEIEGSERSIQMGGYEGREREKDKGGEKKKQLRDPQRERGRGKTRERAGDGRGGCVGRCL